MLYLNEEFEGGHTRFFDETQPAYSAPYEDKVVCTYEPRCGDALVFYSELMHDGEALQGGQKWILRSEVMYEAKITRDDEQLTRFFDALHNGSDGVVVGLAATVAAVREGRAATVLVSIGMGTTHEGQPLTTWLSAHKAGQVDAESGMEVLHISADAAGGAGWQFLLGLEGVGAFLWGKGTAGEPAEPSPSCVDEDDTSDEESGWQM